MPNAVASHATAGAMKICEPMLAVESQAPSSNPSENAPRKIRQADRRQPGVEIGEERAEQHGGDRKQRFWRDTAERDGPAVGVVICCHSSPHRRYGCW